jgi:hypothetical protein
MRTKVTQMRTKVTRTRTKQKHEKVKHQIINLDSARNIQKYNFRKTISFTKFSLFVLFVVTHRPCG